MDATQWRITNEDSSGEPHEMHEMVAYLNPRYRLIGLAPHALRVVCSCNRTWQDHWIDGFTGHADLEAIFNDHLTQVNQENDAIAIANRLGFC